MANPWERFAQAPQPQAQPWAKFAQPEQAPVAPPQAQPVQPNQPQGTDNFSAKGAAMGVLDPVYGVGQMVPRALSAVTSLGGLAPNPVSRAYDRSAGLVDESFKGTEQNYQAGRQNPDDMDWGRLTGNVISPMNWFGAGAPIKGASLGANLVKGMGLGAAYGASAPVSDTENFASNKAQQVGWGTASGVVAPLLGAGINKVLNPQTDPAVKGLLNEGIKLTPGEIAGGSLKRGEDMMTSWPLVGGIVKSAQKRSIESMNTAAMNRALSPIGENLPNNVNLGRDAVQYVGDKLGQAYDDVLPKLTGKIDKPFADAMDDLDDMVVNDFVMSEPSKEKYKTIMDRVVRNRFSQNGSVMGQGIKDIESNLGDLSKQFGQSLDPSDKQLSAVLSEAQDALRSMLQRNNPEYADRLSAINRGYANFKRVQKAAASLGSDEGIFSPAQLQSAVKALDRSKDKSAFAKGTALMQDLSEPAKARMAQSVPNSGSIDRAAAMGLGAVLTGSTAVSPLAAIPAALSLGYVPGGRKLAEVMLSKRPDLIRKAGPMAQKYISALGVPLAAPLANQVRD